MRYRARKATRLVAYALILIIAVVTFTGKLHYFTLTIGLISAGLAFALQEVVLSIAGWIAIYSSRIYKPGDRVEINDVKGDVIDISLTKTTLMEIGKWVKSDNYNGRIVKVNNSAVFKGTISNYSTDFPFLWDEVEIPVRYGSDMQLAQQIITEISNKLLLEYAEFAKEHWKIMVKNYRIENANVKPTVTVRLTDNWIEFTLRYVVDYKQRRLTKDNIYREIQKGFEQSEGKVALASSTFEITQFPEIKVNFTGKDKP